jgi:hypothetical protein
MKTAPGLGLTVVSSDPRQRGFNQPCPLWEGQCTIYDSPNYPHYCGVYKCKLLKRVIDETAPLSEGLEVVQGAKSMIREVESFLPVSSNKNFRERLVEHLENSSDESSTDPEFQRKAHALLEVYKNQFGVNDLVDSLEEF